MQRRAMLKGLLKESDQRNRKLIKIALGAAALSLGVDVTSLL